MRKLKFPVGLAVCGLLATALLVGRPIVHAQGGGPVLNPAQVLGPNVTFTWSAVAGASSYVLRAGIAPGQYLLAADIGNTATYVAQAPAVGTYFVRVDAIVGGVPMPSNEISFQVVSLSVPPAAPTNLAAYANGVAALLTWDLGSGGSAATSMVVYSRHHARWLGRGPLPLAAGTQLFVPAVNPGTYYLRVAAANNGGISPASNEATLVMPPGGGCSAPPARTINTLVFGQYVRLSWAPCPAPSAYQLNYTGTFAGSSTIPGEPDRGDGAGRAARHLSSDADHSILVRPDVGRAGDHDHRGRRATAGTAHAEPASRPAPAATQPLQRRERGGRALPERVPPLLPNRAQGRYEPLPVRARARAAQGRQSLGSQLEAR